MFSRCWIGLGSYTKTGESCQAPRSDVEDVKPANPCLRYRNAGFFIFVDLGPWLEPPDPLANESESNQEFLFAKKCLDAGVSLQPGEEHGDRPGLFRLVFSQEREILTEGLRR